jgi:fatty-acyl-CoA synthase
MEKSSYLKGESQPALLDLTIGQALQLAVSRWPQQEALVSVHQELRLSWAELERETESFAAGLLALGLRAGDRVGVWAPNCAQWTITQLATARAGLIQVNINPAYRASELQYTLNKVGVAALICASRFKSSDFVQMVEDLAPEIPTSRAGQLRSQNVPSLRNVILTSGETRPGWLAFGDVHAAGGGIERAMLATGAIGLTADDAINIQFTSGTTGLPKGATLSHRNILNNAYYVGLGMGLREGDRLCIPVPLYHCFGMVMGNLACLVHGAAMIYPSEGFDPLAVLRAVEKERCTALHGVPTMFIAELGHPEFDRFDLSSLRTGIMAGSPCPVEVMRKVIDRMHMSEIGIAYGMTETSPVSFQTTVDDSIERRVTSIGRVQPNLEVKIVAPDGNTVPRNTPGELCTRGYSVMLGYWEDSERTAEAIDSEGWMHTGDLATIDDEGYGNIVGRIKDMVIRGGENVYPREVEEYLFKHAKVQDVAVVGVPDSKYGEEICAWIRLKDGQSATGDEIVAFCRGQIAHYKIPRYIRFVEEFPTTVTGKIQKYLIRSAMIEELRLAESENMKPPAAQL